MAKAKTYTHDVGGDWSGQRPCVMLRQSSGQTIATGVSDHFITWQVCDYMVSPLWVSGDNTKITIVVNGLYLFNAGIVFSNTIPSGSYVEWGLSGPSSSASLFSQTTTDSGGAWWANTISGVHYCTKGEYYRVNVKHNCGSDRTTYPDGGNKANFFAATYLGGLAV